MEDQRFTAIHMDRGCKANLRFSLPPREFAVTQRDRCDLTIGEESQLHGAEIEPSAQNL